MATAYQHWTGLNFTHFFFWHSSLWFLLFSLTGKHLSTAEESVTLDNGGFTALELNSRTLNTKNSFLKKNGTRCVCSPPRTLKNLLDLWSDFFINVACIFNMCVCVSRSPPRPSPGGLHYSDEDICNNYNGAVLTESTTLTEKHTEVSESEVYLSLSLIQRLYYLIRKETSH